MPTTFQVHFPLMFGFLFICLHAQFICLVSIKYFDFKHHQNKFVFDWVCFPSRFRVNFLPGFCNHLKITFWCGTGRASLVHVHQHTVPLEQYHTVETFLMVANFSDFCWFFSKFENFKNPGRKFWLCDCTNTHIHVYYLESRCMN